MVYRFHLVYGYFSKSNKQLRSKFRYAFSYETTLSVSKRSFLTMERRLLYKWLFLLMLRTHGTETRPLRDPLLVTINELQLARQVVTSMDTGVELFLGSKVLFALF